MKQSSFVLYNKQHSKFFWFHSLAHITIATKTIHFTVTPIPTCLERPERTNYQLTDSLNFHKGRNYTSCEHAECYKLFTPCTTPAQHLHFPNWTLETGKPTTTIKEKYFINRTEDEMLNLVFSHAAFMQQNSITETILYLQHSLHTAQVQTEVHSLLLRLLIFFLYESAEWYS